MKEDIIVDLIDLLSIISQYEKTTNEELQTMYIDCIKDKIKKLIIKYEK